MEKRSAIDLVSLFDTSPFRCHKAAFVKAMDSNSFPGRKSLWQISRSIALAFAAANSGLQDAGIDTTVGKHPEIGVAFGTTLGGLSPLLQLDRQALSHGPRAADPMLFPSAGASAPSCQISITLGMQAFNTTLSNGQTSGLDAIQYAAQFIRLGRAETVLAGGVEEISLDTFRACCDGRLLAGSRTGTVEEMRPFDVDRNGFVLGEGAGVLVMESLEHALARNARIYAEFTGYASVFAPSTGTRFHAAATAMRNAASRAGRAASDIGAVFASANGSRAGDRVEGQAIRAAMPGRPVSSIKPVVGESYSAAGAIQSVAAILSLHHQVLPGTGGFTRTEQKNVNLHVLRETREAKFSSVMVNAFGRTGNHATAVFSSYAK
jgi:3-oxoacyl-[acyl-carrier-protein] synthase II